MKRLFGCLLVLLGLFVAGCQGSGQRQDRDARLRDGQPQVEATVQQ